MKAENGERKSSFLPRCLNGRYAGRVHSKFKRGINLEFTDCLIHLGVDKAPLSAMGLNIEEEKMTRLLAAVRIDDIVINKDDALLFYSIQGEMPVAYGNLKEIDLKLRATALSRKKITDSFLYRRLEDCEWESCIGIALDEKTSESVTLLLQSDKSDAQMNGQLIAFFIGRGKGLTPSGDDILTGFTLALQLFGDFAVWRNSLEKEVAKKRTTSVSLAYLTALLQGYASEPFITLINALDEEKNQIIEETLEEIKRLGHTSGSDTLFGLFLGLQFLAKE
ncbi:DUF2877 domain-containing protein [Azotosporobacter soli]|uniref:DUF2877 domain-containing protein n=1 Tax=Azotosporobacter soli TaxID=3055040 RepID=UPI0031FE806C